MWTHKQQERERTERLRGMIINFLAKAKPRPVEFPVLFRLLDRMNYPVSRRRLAQEIDYLRSLHLVRVFPLSNDTNIDDTQGDLSETQQARLVQRYCDTDSDDEMGGILCARITTAGINFQDGLNDIAGISRVE